MPLLALKSDRKAEGEEESRRGNQEEAQESVRSEREGKERGNSERTTRPWSIRIIDKRERETMTIVVIRRKTLRWPKSGPVVVKQELGNQGRKFSQPRDHFLANLCSWAKEQALDCMKYPSINCLQACNVMEKLREEGIGRKMDR